MNDKWISLLEFKVLHRRGFNTGKVFMIGSDIKN